MSRHPKLKPGQKVFVLPQGCSRRYSGTVIGVCQATYSDGNTYGVQGRFGLTQSHVADMVICREGSNQ